MKMRTGGKTPHVSASKLGGDECFYCLYFDSFTYDVNCMTGQVGPKASLDKTKNQRLLRGLEPRLYIP
jgi:hypothetical protein